MLEFRFIETLLQTVTYSGIKIYFLYRILILLIWIKSAYVLLGNKESFFQMKNTLSRK